MVGRVSHGKDRELNIGEIRLLTVSRSGQSGELLDKGLCVLWHIALTTGGAHDNQVRMISEVSDLDFVKLLDRHFEPTLLGQLGCSVRHLLGVTRLGTIQNGHRSGIDVIGRRQDSVSPSSLGNNRGELLEMLKPVIHPSAQILHTFFIFLSVALLHGSVSHLRLDHLGNIDRDLLGVQNERSFAFLAQGRVEAEQGIVPRVGRDRHVLHRVAHAVHVLVLNARGVGQDQRRARVGFCLHKRAERLLHARTHRTVSHVHIAIRHCHIGHRFLVVGSSASGEFGDSANGRTLARLTASIRVHLSVEHEHVDVLVARQHVVKSAVSNVEGPAVATNIPN